ncbi:MAG: hypothetical protein Unbinned4162contig1001_2 [Prokaryotic dsDNA virus sp.]|nr:MAG: hypothetical protein Unbinned4162contig1001_2 [Prokaryotic dsDNA virus sp.]|tara:strand:+ start:27742 stop:28008 length:267 start_codon:yes stop_codon:yes gene_type:complete
MRSVITHWIPIITFCPVNNLPDPIFIEVHTNDFMELYEVRRKIRKCASFKNMFMEDVAKKVLQEVGGDKVVVRLWFNKHRVEITKEDL